MKLIPIDFSDIEKSHCYFIFTDIMTPAMMSYVYFKALNCSNPLQPMRLYMGTLLFVTTDGCQVYEKNELSISKLYDCMIYNYIY